MESRTVKIDGMTCISCENRISEALNITPGISSVRVSYAYGTASVTYDDNLIKYDDITAIIEKLGYRVVKPMEKKAEKPDYAKILGFAIILLAIYMVVNAVGGFRLFNYFPQAKEGMGYGMLFVIGILTSFHCVAMCGGIGLSQCNITAEDTDQGHLRPSILYNLGRVLSYTIIGGVVGAIGNFVSFTGTVKGIVQLIAGLFMVIMGINMLNLFPWLKKLSPRMPAVISNRISKEKKKHNNGAFYVGLLNGLMPCGPLQAMQIYALSTASPVKGALSMFIFSLGTVPLMFGIGALSSYLNKKFAKNVAAVSGVLVVVLGMFMFARGMSLTGFVVPFDSDSPDMYVKAVIQDDVQVVTTTLSPGKYDVIKVQAGVPVRWIIKADIKISTDVITRS